MEYQELIDLGFTHIEDSCPQWKAQYGYEYFRVEYHVDKRLFFDWDVQKQTVRMVKLEKDKNTILEQWEIPNKETLTNLLRVLGKPKKKLIYPQQYA